MSGRPMVPGLTLDEVVREGVRRMLAAALEAEVEHYVEARDAAGRRLVARHGLAQPRTVENRNLRERFSFALPASTTGGFPPTASGGGA